jgi:hypothetical protein
MCRVEFDDVCTLWTERYVCARKGHVCDCCAGPIQPGEMYIKHFSIHDGYPTSEKCCHPCQTMREKFREEHGTVGNPGSMPPLLDQCIEAEEDEHGEDAPMAAKWRGELAAMKERKEARAAS